METGRLARVNRRPYAIVQLALAMALAVVAFSCTLACGAATCAYAATEGGLAAGAVALTAQDEAPALMDRTFWAYSDEEPSLSTTNWPDNAKVVSVKSSNSKAVKIKSYSGSKTDLYNYYISIGKPGTSKITLKYKVGSKSRTLSATYTVKKFPNVIKKLTFNGAALKIPTSKNAISGYTLYNFTGTKGKLGLKLADGWKVGYVSVYVWSLNGDSSKTIDTEIGKTFTIPKGKAANISLYIYDEDSDDSYYSYYLHVWRNQPHELAAGTCYVGYPCYPSYSSYADDSKGVKVVKVASSNAKVLKAKKVKGKYFSKQILLTPIKVGKSKVTVTYKYGGKTYTTRATYKVQKNFPLKSLKLNGVKVNLKKNMRYYFVKKYTKSKASIKVDANTGWKIKSITNNKGTRVKNGGSIKTPKGSDSYIIIELQNNSTKAIYPYAIEINR